MPRHSVILGSYNRPKLIRLALDSVFAQTVQDFEVIITDDGSNEETLSAILDRIVVYRSTYVITKATVSAPKP